MKGVILSLQFLTRLPLPRVQATEQEFAASMRWFPVAGVAVGAAVMLPWVLINAYEPWLAALAGLIGWVAMTGALHLDGLADVADGMGAAHRGKDRLSAVMADPHVGSFAVVVLVLQLLAKLLLLHSLPLASWPALLLVPILARIAPIAWALYMPSLHDGLGSSFRSHIRLLHLVIWSIVATVGAIMFAPSLLVVFALVPVWRWWLLSRLGGISGDGHGAGIELIETALLIALVIAW